jgi:hypothetical protein
MPSLVEKLAKDPVRPLVITDCVELIDAQVKQKGFVIKSAYATIKAIKKRFIPEVVDSMLDEWLEKLQPHFDRTSPRICCRSPTRGLPRPRTPRPRRCTAGCATAPRRT